MTTNAPKSWTNNYGGTNKKSAVPPPPHAENSSSIIEHLKKKSDIYYNIIFDIIEHQMDLDTESFKNWFEFKCLIYLQKMKELEQ